MALSSDEEVSSSLSEDGRGNYHQWVKKKATICMVSDFFFPGLGGVEMHIYQLAICLIARGHKVVVLTHSRRNRVGVRYMSCGLKVYYYPCVTMVESCIWPTIFNLLPLVREVLVRENVDIVHGHQASSTMTHECLFHARTLGYHTVYTDHSLFGFSDAGVINMNKVLKFWLMNVDHAICVSHTNKENLVLRAALPPHIVSVIPNALDSARFTPNPKTQKGRVHLEAGEPVTICIVSRLTYRKGVDLLVESIPLICSACPDTKFIIGGDGPKRIILEETRERHGLHDRITLLGAIPHDEVCKVLRQGHIFLNASLTEAFCIAIIEAASSGLLVVSTSVGGVVEVMPPHLVTLVEPCGRAIAAAVIGAVKRVRNGELDPWAIHEEVSKMYKWEDVARRTDIVYSRILTREPPTLYDSLRNLCIARSWSAKFFAFIVIAEYVWAAFWCWWRRVEDIEVVPDVKYGQYMAWKHIQESSGEAVNLNIPIGTLKKTTSSFQNNCG